MTRKLLYVIGFAAVLALPQVLPEELNWLIMLLDRALMIAIVAIGLNILTGNAGQISLGHAAFMGFGAFACYGLTDIIGVPFWFSVPIAGFVAAILGWGLGFPALRLSGHYLAIATLGFGYAIPQILNLFEGWTGGWTGVKPSVPTLFGISFSSDRAYFYLILVTLVVLVWIARNIQRSAVGRAFIALRDSEVAAQAMGISLAKYKTMAFAISAFYAGVAGGLWAHWLNYISPGNFGFGISIELFTIIVLGGLGTVSGAIVGALFLGLLPKLTEIISLSLQRSGAFADSFFMQNVFKNSNQVLTGVILILVVLYLPMGLVDLWRKARVWWETRRQAAGRQAVPRGVK